jgi:hypothetical protein
MLSPRGYVDQHHLSTRRHRLCLLMSVDRTLARTASRVATDPAVPAVLWLVLVLLSPLISVETVAWVGFGAAAGYALSGSV